MILPLDGVPILRDDEQEVGIEIRPVAPHELLHEWCEPFSAPTFLHYHSYI